MIGATFCYSKELRKLHLLLPKVAAIIAFIHKHVKVEWWAKEAKPIVFKRSTSSETQEKTAVVRQCSGQNNCFPISNLYKKEKIFHFKYPFIIASLLDLCIVSGKG